jgi:hypothetical protein
MQEKLGAVDNYGLYLALCDSMFYILVKAILFNEIEGISKGEGLENQSPYQTSQQIKQILNRDAPHWFSVENRSKLHGKTWSNSHIGKLP